MLQCPAADSSLLPLMVSTLAIPDDLRHIASHGEEDWDPAYIIHLHPVATLRNLLPYTIRYMLEVQHITIIHQVPHRYKMRCVRYQRNPRNKKCRNESKTNNGRCLHTNN